MKRYNEEVITHARKILLWLNHVATNMWLNFGKLNEAEKFSSEALKIAETIKKNFCEDYGNSIAELVEGITKLPISEALTFINEKGFRPLIPFLIYTGPYGMKIIAYETDNTFLEIDSYSAKRNIGKSTLYDQLKIKQIEIVTAREYREEFINNIPEYFFEKQLSPICVLSYGQLYGPNIITGSGAIESWDDLIAIESWDGLIADQEGEGGGKIDE